jgi:hypothetical protein
MEITRRQFSVGAGLAGTLALLNGPSFASMQKGSQIMQEQSKSKGFWPNGARLAISISLMFEGGGQPISGAGGPITEPIKDGLPDLPTNAFFAYGHYEGIPRALNLFDKHKIKVIADSVETIHRITGQTAIGWNAYWLRSSVHILETLQELGFLYSIDEPSHDEPFVIPVKGKDFVIVPYTFHMNDISSYPFEGYNPQGYEQALRDEFDQLYEEGASRRRLMLIGMHDRINGHANRIRVLDRSLTYATSHEDVWFARKDEIAKWALEHREDTPILHRGPASGTGLPGA